MKRNMKIVCSLILFAGILLINTNVFSQTNCTCAICGRSCNDIAIYGHIKGYSCYVAPANSAAKSSAGSSADLSNMIAGAIFQNVLTSIFSNNTANNQKELDAKQKAAALAAQQAAQKAAEQQRMNEAIAQAEYEKMMKSYKLLEDSRDMNIKTLDNSNMEFKTLDGDAETLSNNSRNQFENTTISPVSAQSNPGNPTPFFGDAMPLADIQTLLNPEANPNIVDLRSANGYVADNIEKDSLGIVQILRPYETEGTGEPIIQKPDCKELGRKLKGYTDQRQQFQKTIDLSQKELEIWETANRNAMINAAKDGLEYFTGQLLEGLTNRGKAADRLQQVYDKNAQQMVNDGINVAELQAKIQLLRNISASGQIAELAASMNDWQSFIKDGLSSVITRLSDSNTEVKNLLDDPNMQKYFQTEKPELNALLDISKIAASNMIFGKWIAKKIPLVACIELSIKQLYNGTDYLLSLNRIIQAQKINGGVMITAQYIQKNIDNTYAALSQCQQ